MEDLEVALVQSHITWHQPEENLKSVIKQIEKIGKADLIVLPEMWSTGFTMKTHLFHSFTPKALEQMKLWSRDFKAAVVGSLITKDGDNYYNRAYVVIDGEVKTTYDKKHLFAFSGEDRYFNSGNEICVFEYREWKICLNICYDLRFPVWSRNVNVYDILLYCANWPDQRIDAWNTLLKARAIENQSYVLGVNCSGVDAWRNTYSGHTTLVNYDGSNEGVIIGKEDVLIKKLKFSKLQKFRKKFPFLSDRDSFLLKND